MCVCVYVCVQGFWEDVNVANCLATAYTVTTPTTSDTSSSSSSNSNHGIGPILPLDTRDHLGR